jgi:DNA ligase D-like protein (predicted ligase)
MKDLFESNLLPMLPKRISQPFDSSKHLFEFKWDGIRALLFISSNHFRLQNRKLQNVSYRYPELFSVKKVVKKGAILDGEIVVISGGKPDFKKIQERDHQEKEDKIEVYRRMMPVTYVAFDLLYFDGNELFEASLFKRKELLYKNFVETPRFIFSRGVEREGKRFYERALRLGFEGAVAKEIDSPYLPGKRSSYWLKIKKEQTRDLIICGFIPGKGERENLFGSLILGAYDGRGNLKFVSKVGSGFTKRDMKFLLSLLTPLKKDSSPFFKEEAFKLKGKVFWVEPRIVCEVKFVEFTSLGSLRSPIFLRLRPDKSAEECVLKEEEG